MAKKHERTLARRMAVQALYQSEITGTDLSAVAGDVTIIPDAGALPEYAVSLLAAVHENAEVIDKRISKASENWSLSRMPIVDRAILRASVCEIFYIEDVPVSVSINEAVELAKEFGGEDESSRFVNGILGRIARSIDAGEDILDDADEAAEEPADGAEEADGSADQLAEEQAGDEQPEDGQEPADAPVEEPVVDEEVCNQEPEGDQPSDPAVADVEDGQ